MHISIIACYIIACLYCTTLLLVKFCGTCGLLAYNVVWNLNWVGGLVNYVFVCKWYLRLSWLELNLVNMS
ncbi:hypothetical protein C2G38_2061309, partial [Gigaspora rosea]